MAAESPNSNQISLINQTALAVEAERYLKTVEERRRFRDQVIANQPLRASRIAESSFVAPRDSVDGMKELEKYKTRLRHWINDDQDLKDPTDQRMIWSFFSIQAQRLVLAFIHNSPLTLLADQLISLLGVPNTKLFKGRGIHDRLGLYQQVVEATPVPKWLFFSSDFGQKYYKAHMIELDSIEVHAISSIRRKKTCSGFVVDYGDNSSNSIMALRNMEFGTLQYHFVDQFDPTNGSPGVMYVHTASFNLLPVMGSNAALRQEYARTFKREQFVRVSYPPVKKMFDTLVE